MSLHGIVMIISILIGIAGFMNYLIPLLIGARDMAFPRLNAFSFWIAVPAGVILLSSMVLGGVDTGWTGYPPLSARAPIGHANVLSGGFLSRLLIDPGRVESHRHRHSLTGEGNGRISHAHLRLGRPGHLGHHLDCHPIDRFIVSNGHVRTFIWNGFF